MYFIKLNGEFNLSESEKIRDVVSYGVGEKQFKGIQYTRIKIPNMNDVYKVIPKEYRKYFGLIIFVFRLLKKNPFSISFLSPLPTHRIRL